MFDVQKTMKKNAKFLLLFGTAILVFVAIIND